MKKIDKFLIGMGFPDAGIEKDTFIDVGNERKDYGGEVTLYASDPPLMYFDEVEFDSKKPIRKSLIFLANYSRKVDFEFAVEMLKGIINEFNFQEIKISPDIISIGDSRIIDWRYMNPVSLVRAIELANKGEYIIKESVGNMEIFKYTGKTDKVTGGKIYRGKNSQEFIYYRKLLFPTKYSMNKIDDYIVFDTGDEIVLLGKNSRATGTLPNNSNVKEIIENIKRNSAHGWVLKEFSQCLFIYERRAGPFKIVKSEYTRENSTQYEVLSSSGFTVFETSSRRFGEKLNYRKIKEILL